MNPDIDRSRFVGADILPTSADIAPAELKSPIQSQVLASPLDELNRPRIVAEDDRSQAASRWYRFAVDRRLVLAVLVLILIAAASFAISSFGGQNGPQNLNQNGSNFANLNGVAGSISANDKTSTLKLNYSTLIADGKTFTAKGPVVIQNDSVNGFNVQTAAGNDLLVVDTAAGKVGVGGAPTGAAKLQVNGNLSVNGNIVSTTGAYSLSPQGLTLGGVLVCTSAGCQSAQAANLTGVALLAGNNNFTGVNKFTAGGNVFAGDGSGISALNAGNVASGTLSDARLSANVALAAGNNTFSGSNTFTSQIQASGGIDASAYSVSGTPGANLTCSSGDLVQNAVITGGIITGGSCVPGAGASIATLQESYDASTPATVVLSSASGVLQLQDAATPLGTNLFEVASNGGATKYFAVSATGASVTGTFNATTLQQAGVGVLTQNTNFSGDISGTYNSTVIGVGAVNSSKILDGTIVNADINGAAAIAYSKLNLTGSIINADINAAASISYSKLNLAGSVTNTDIAAAAGIAYSKLALNNSIVNSDISAGAAISYSKLNLTGSIQDSDVSAGSHFAFTNANNTFTGNNTFNNSITAPGLVSAGASLGIGGSGASLLLAGNYSSDFSVTNGTQTTSVGFSGVPARNVNYNFDVAAAAGTYTICTTAANCVGVSGGAIGGSGTANKLAKFTGSGFTIGDSILTDNGTTVSVAGTLTATTLQQGGTGVLLQTTSFSGDISGAYNSISVDKLKGTALSISSLANTNFLVYNSTSGNWENHSITGDITVDNSGVSAIGSGKVTSTNILDGTIANVDISGTAAISYSKLNLAGSVTNTDIANAAGIAYSKLNLSGSIQDSDVSAGSHFAFTNANNTFTGNNTFNNSITAPGVTAGGAALGIGASGDTLSLNGTYGSTLAVTDGTHTTTVAFSGVPAGNVTYDFDVAAAAGTYTICTTANTAACAASGGVTTSGGTANKLAKFTGSGFTIGDSILTDNGTTVSVAGTLTATTLQQGGTGVLLQTTAFSGDLSGTYNSTSVDKLKGTALSISSLADTNFLVYNSTSGNWENHSITGDITVDNSGVSAIGSGKVTSSNILDGTIANVDISGTAAISYSKLNLAGSVTNSDIAAAAGISYSKLNLTGSIQDSDVSAGSHFAFTNANNTFTGNNTFNNSITAPGVTAGGAALGIGASGDTLSLNGTYSSTLAVTDGTNTTTVAFSGTPTGNVTYDFDASAAPNTYTICTTAANCVGVSGGAIGGSGTANKLAKFTGSGFTIGDSILTDNGTTVSVAGTLTATTLQQGGTGVLLQTTAFSGDVSGTYNSTSVDKLKGTPLSISSLADTNFLIYNSTSGNWENHSLSSDLTVDHSGIATIANGAVTSAKIADGTIANVDISGTAAISYSKLNLSGSVTNSDIAAAAGIAYSKLNLNGSIQDSDVSAGSHFAFTNIANTFTAAQLIKVDNNNALQVQDSSTNSILNVDTLNNKVSLNNLNLAGTGNVANAITKSMVVTSAVNAGDVVIIDTANPGQATTTTTGNSNLIYGVATATKAAGQTQDIVIGGTYQVNVDATSTVAVGDFIATSATAGKVTTNNNPAAGTILGRALSAVTVPGAGQTVWVQVTPDVGGGVAGTGVTSIGAIDTQTKSANGAVIVGTTLYLQTADAGAPGLVSTGAQTFAGNKTFNGTVNATTLQQGGTGVLLQTTAFSGDLSGTYNSTSVDKLKGTALSISSLADTNFLVYNSTSGNWENHSITGDITVDHSGVATIGVGKVTSSNILDGTIANADISGTAAISYSKLNLAGSIQDGDVSASSHFAFTNANQTFTGNNGFSQQVNVSGTLATSKGTDLSAVNIDDQAVSTSLLRLTGTSQIVTGFAGGRDGQILTLINAGTNTATIANSSVSSLAANRITTGTGADYNLPVGAGITLVYDSADSLWRLTATATGVTSVGAIDTQTPSANGAVITGNSVYLQSASGTAVGLVNTSAQAFAGAKTFNSLLTAGAGLSASGGAVSLQGNANSSLTTTSGTLTLQGAGATSLLTTDVASGSSSNITVASGNVTAGAGASGNVSIDVGTSTGTTGTIAIGTANASAVAIGLAGKTTTVNGALTVSQLLTASSSLSVTGSVTASSDINSSGGAIQTGGTSRISNTGNLVNIGTINGNTLDNSGNLTFGNAGAANIDAAAGQSLNIGGGGGAHTTTVGGVTGASGTVIQSGSGGISLSGATTVLGTNTFTVNGGNTSLGANLDVTSSVAFKHGVDMSTTGSLDDLNVGNVSLIRLSGASTQTLTGVTGGRDGQILTIINAATQAAVIANQSASSTTPADRIFTGTGGNISLPVDGSITLVYDSQASRWRVVGDVNGGSGSGVTTVGTFTSCTSYANGAQIASNTITLGCADITNPGLVSTGAQTWGGAKSFNGLITGSAGLTVTGGAVSLTGNAASSLATTSGALSLQGAGGVNLTTTDVASGSSTNITIASGNVTAGGGASGNVGIDVGTSTGTNGTISIGTATASAVTIGRTGVVTTNTGSLTVSQTLTANGGISLGVNQNILYGIGSGNFDAHNATGTFQTSSGNNSLNGNTTVTGTNTFTVNGGNTTLGANLDVTGSAALKKGTDFSTTGTTNDAAFANASLIRLTGASAQTITGIAGGRDGEILTLVNAGTAGATLTDNDAASLAANRIRTGTGTSISIPVNSSQTLIYDAGSSVWRLVGQAAGSSGSGVTTVGAIDTQTASANGAVISGNSIYLQSASNTAVGLVNTSAQTFAGAKTFSSLITGSAGISTSGGAVTLQGNAASSLTTTSGALSLQGAGGVNLTTPNVAGAATSNITIATGNVTSGAFASGNVSIDVGTSTGTTGTISIGTANASGVTISRSGQTTAVSGLLTVASTINGNTFDNAGNLTFGNAGAANINAASTQTLNLGTAANNHTTALGSTNGTSTTNVQSGSGGINLVGNVNVNSTNTFTVNGGLTSLGANLDVTGSSAFKKGTDFSTTGTTNDAAFANASLIRLTGASAQIITGIAVTGGNRDGQLLSILNAGTASATINNNDAGSAAANRITTGTGSAISLPVGSSITLIYDSAASLWRVDGQAAGASGSGVTNVGNIDTQTKSANGAVIVGNSIVLQTADANFPGLVSTSSQTLNGAKTFQSLITGQAGITVTGGAITLQGNAASQLTTSTGNLSLTTTAAASQVTIDAGTAGNGTVAIGNSTANIINIGSNNAAHTINIGNTGATGVQAITIGGSGNSGNTVTIDAGTGSSSIAIGNSATAHNISIGAGGTAAQNINIGSSSSNGTVTIQGGTGNSVQLLSQGTILIGNNNVAQNVTIGNATGATSVAIQCGSGSCGIGANATDHPTTVGSVTGASLTTLQGGTSGISLTGNTTVGGNLSVSGTNTLTVNNGATTLGSTLDVTGSTALKKGTDFSTTGTTVNAGFANASLIRLTGASAQTIDGIAGGRDGYILTLINAAAQAATIVDTSVSTATAANQVVTGTGQNYSLAAGSSVNLIYDVGSSRWRMNAGSAGVTTIGTYSSSNHYANGASITGNTLTLGSANSTNPGLVDTGAQTFEGAKTLSDTLTINNLHANPIATFQDSGSTVLGLSNVGLLTLQPAAGLTNGQSALTQTLNNSSSTGGTVNGYNQSINVTDSTSASTTNGINIAITDATTLANSNNGINITVTDNGASGTKTNKAVIGTAGGTNTNSTNYGGYFSLSGGSASSSAIYGSNGTTSGNILQLQDNSTDVLKVANDGATTISSINAAAGNAANVLTVTGGNGAGTASAGNGSNISLTAGNGGNGSTTNGNGGNLTLSAGAAGTGAGSAGTAGSVIVKNQSNSTTAFQVQNASSSPILSVDTTGTGAVTVSGNVIAGAKVDITGSEATKKGTDYSTTGTSNNVNFGDASLIRLTGASAQTITGIANGRDGFRLTLINAVSNTATLKNNDTTDSSAANVIITGTGSDLSVAAGASVSMVYDSGSSVWRVIGTSSAGGATATLQQAYDASTSSPQITLDASPGASGLVIQDASSPLGTNLFTVQSNGAGTKYLQVAATGVTVSNLTSTGTITANGGINVAASQTIVLNGGNTASRPGSPTKGTLYYDTTTNNLISYNGTKWVGAPKSNTFIVAANNSTQAEKDAADAVATGTGDQATINGFFTSAPCNTIGCTVYLMEGTYSLTAAISVPNNSTLTGAGAATVITVPNAQNGSYNMITNTDTSTGTNVTISNLLIDGNKANQTSGSMIGIYFNGIGSGTTREGGNITKVTINNMFGGSAKAISLNNSNNNLISNNLLQANANYGVYLNSSSNNTLSSNNIEGSSYDIWLDTPSNNNVISANSLQAVVTNVVLSSSSYNSLTANSIQGGNSIGIDLFSASNYNAVTGNVLAGNKLYGIYINGSNNVVSSNKIQDSGDTTNNYGIFLSSASKNSITGNDITDSSCTTNCYAINIDNVGATSNFLSNNHFLGDGTHAASVRDVGTTTIYSGQQLTENGDASFRNATNSATAFQIQNASGTNLFNVDTTNSLVGTAATSTASTNSSSFNLQTGNASGATSNSGSVSIDVGTATGTTGTISIGTANASDITIGKTSGSAITTINGGGGITLGNNTTVSNDKSFTAGGTALFKDNTNSATAFQVQNSVGTSLLNVDSTNARISVDSSYSTMATSFGTITVVDGGAGSLISGSQYYYEITAIDSAGGETTPSGEGTLGTGHTALTVSWTAIAGASGYKIYRSTTSGSEAYLTTVLNNTFTDTGAIAGGGASVPASNTAYISTNNSNSELQLSVGGLGTPAGQIYVGGTQPMYISSNNDSTLSAAKSVYVQGRYAYVVSFTNNTLAIYDVNNPVAPTLVGSTTASLSSPLSVSVQGRYAYVTNSVTNKLSIYNVSNPSSPTFVASNSDGNLSGPGAVFISGRYAYVASATNSKLAVCDISNPASFSCVVNSDSNLSTPKSVYVQGHYAYVASGGNNKLVIYDISNPASPTFVASNSDGNLSLPNSVYVSGRYAYVSSQSNKKLVIYDISNPASPTFVAKNPDTNLNGPSSVFVQGRYAYLLSGGIINKLVVYDVSNPASPTFVAKNSDNNLNQPSYAFIQGRYAYIAGGSANNISIYDLGGAYTQQLEAGGIEAGTLSVDNNIQTAGDVSVAGGLQVGGTAQFTANAGIAGALNVTGATATSGNASDVLTVVGGNGAGTASAGNGSNISLTAGNGGSGATANGNGGNLTLSAGAAGGGAGTAGTAGSVIVKNQSNSATAFQVQNSSGRDLLNVDTSGSVITVGNTTDGSQISLAASGNANATITKNMPVTGTVNAHDLVVIDSSNDGHVKTTTTANDTKVFGIATGSGATQDIVIGGTYQVNLIATNAAISPGDYLVSTTTAGKVDKSSGVPPSGTAIGQALQTVGANAGGTIWVYVTPGEGGTGVGGSTTLQQAYDYSTSSPQITLDSSPGAGGLLIRDNSTPLATNTLFSVQNNAGSTKFLDIRNNGFDILGAGASTITTNSGNLTIDTTSGSTPTLNIGTGAQNKAIAIGNSQSSTTITSIAGAVTDTLSNTGETIKTNTNSATAFQVQGSAGSSATLLTADSTNMRIGVDNTYSSMGTGFGTPTVTDAGAGSLASGSQYYYEITAIDSSGGETTPSAEGTVGSTGHTALNISWTAITGASGYKIYRTTTSGSYGASSYLTTVLTNSYKDTGSVSLATGTPPGSNTAYVSTNTSNSALQLSVGGLGTPTGQVYVSGTLPVDISSGGAKTAAVPTSIFVQGHYAYVTVNSNKLQVLDVSNPSVAKDVSNGGVSTGTGPVSVFVQGRYAYLVDDTATGRLEVFDVSNPSNPTSVGLSSTTMSFPFSVYVQGRYAYVLASSSNSLYVFDVSSPTSPVDVTNGGVTTGASSSPVSIFVEGRYAYIANSGNSKLSVFDLSNPAKPSDLTGGGVATTTSPKSVYVQGRYAYLAESNGAGTYKLQVFDVSNPASPTDVSAGGVNTANGPYAVYVQGRYAYISDNAAGKFQVFDVSNPYNVQDISSGGISTGSSPTNIFVSGRYAYLDIQGTNKLQIFDLGGAYVQQLESGGLETSTLSVDSNALFSGDASISGGLNVSQTINSGGLAVDYQGTASLGSSTVNGITLGTASITQNTASTGTYNGLLLSSPGAINTTTAAGTLNWNGAALTIANATIGFNGSTINANGLALTTGTINAGGGTVNENGLYIDTSGTSSWASSSASTLNGANINIGSLTVPSTGVFNALNISTNGTSRTLAVSTLGSFTGVNLDLNSNVTANGSSLTGLSIATAADNGGANSNYTKTGLKITSGTIAETQNQSGTYIGADIAMPTITTNLNASAVLKAYGLRVTTASASTSGGFGTVSESGIYIDSSSTSVSSGASFSSLNISLPANAGYTAQAINISAPSSQTLGSNFTGLNLDLNTNVIANGASLTGISIATPVDASIVSATKKGLVITSGSITEATSSSVTGTYVGADITLPSLTTTTAFNTLKGFGLRVTTGNITSNSSSTVVENGLLIDTSGTTTWTGSGTTTLNGANIDVGALATSPSTGSTFNALDISTNGGSRTLTNLAPTTITGINLDLNNGVNTNGNSPTITGIAIQTPAYTIVGNASVKGLTIGAGSLAQPAGSGATGTYVAADITMPALSIPGGSTDVLNSYGLRLTTGNINQASGTVSETGISIDSSSTTLTSGGALNELNIAGGTINGSGIASSATINDIKLTTAALTLTSATTQTLNGINLSSAGALNNTGTAGTINYAGLALATPNVTTGVSGTTILSDGLKITQGSYTVTNINGASGGVNAIDIAGGSIAPATGKIGTINGINISTAALTLGTTGTANINGINLSSPGALNISGAAGTINYNGINFSMPTLANSTGGAVLNATGINLSQTNSLTQSVSSTTNISGLSFSTSGVTLTQNTIAGTINWNGVSVSAPNISSAVVSGNVTANGLAVSTQNISQSNGTATDNGLFINAGGTTFTSGGTLNGVIISNVNSTNATAANALTIGTGWTKQINGNGWSVDGSGNLTVNSCVSGCASTLAQSYNSLGTTGNTITYTTAGGGIIIQDATSTVTDLFTIQNNAGTSKYLQLSLASGTPHLKVYDSTGANYADISYSGGTAIFAASSGTTQVGSGSGTVSVALTGQTDQFLANKTYTTAGSSTYTNDDYKFTRTLTGGSSSNLQGSILRVEDLSTIGSGGTSTPDVLLVSQANSSATGNLINAITGPGGSTKFKVDTTGLVTASTGYTGTGAVTVSSGGAGQLTVQSASGTVTLGTSTALTANGALTVQSTGANALTLQSGGAAAVNLDTGGAAAINIGGTNATALVLGGNTSATITEEVANSSTTAYQLQAAGGTHFITVNSTGNIVQIGSGSTDATAILFGLDSFNSTTEPTEVDGAMYYNTAMAEYRCGREGVWENCGINPIDRGYDIEDDFLGGGTVVTTGTIGQLGWTCQGTGPTAAYNTTLLPTVNHPGILQLSEAATSGDGCTLTPGSAASMIINNTDVIKATVAVGATITNNRLRVGIDNETTANTRPVNGVFWEADSTTNASWEFCTGSGTIACVTATTGNGFASNHTVTASTFVRLSIQVKSTTEAVFCIDGDCVDKTGLAQAIDETTVLTPNIASYNSTTAARPNYVDYFQLRGVTSAAR